MKRFGFALAVVLAAADATAQPTLPPLDRVVAVLDKKAILHSEVQARVDMYVKQLEQQGKKPTAAEIAELRRQVVSAMIDDLLVVQAAEEKHLSTDSREIDEALRHVAENAKMTPEEIFAAAEKIGLSREGYRAEIRRQLLEAKWLYLMVGIERPPAPPNDKRTPEERRAEDEKRMLEIRARELARMRARHYIEVRQ